MMVVPELEHLQTSPQWGAMMHERDGGGSGRWMAPTMPGYCQSQRGENTWSKRLAANNITDTDSWEVRAFAEDSSTIGQWPPRSYNCNFCPREFRTAQALGGHMNVHRRERAQAINNQLELGNGLRTGSETAASSFTAANSGLGILSGGSLCTSPPSQESISSSTPLQLRNSPQDSRVRTYEKQHDSLDLELRLASPAYV